MTNKYITPRRLQTFLNNLKNVFAVLGHKHTMLDLTDYTVDSSLSPTSVNPVQNRVLDAEFEAISEALNVYDAALDDKANISHTHEISDVNNLQVSLDELLVDAKSYTDGIALNKANVSHNHDEVYDAKGSANTALNSAKTYTDNGDTTTLETAKTYTDNAVAQKSQVQIITWGDDD